MYIHNNVSHSFQDLHVSVQTCHGRSDHDRALSSGTIGYLRPI